ncbi:hypothetical protein ENUP19_0159G0029 [Entamoeba nuttalli]|uniref:Rab GTPase activating protein, putative n=2 Tax=Entamoeba nuttalli TaxID=412467 RepID=K2GQC4_ENTNP|nr:Rab GTPase activating protein, putative [Entamoeba nuttalli P19]EKE37103.1 Rab GTPase activating protein, putative [Entamoeba nuttalli P19]|eukprot:XP_008860565.1 Rab GTPase activating protein, putative [Entamoeba nuttalli P19]
MSQQSSVHNQTFCFDHSSSSNSSLVIFNQIERKINGKLTNERVPVIFAFAINGKRKELFDNELLPPYLSEKDSKINWKSPLDKNSVIHMAAIYGKTNFVKQLLSVGVEIAVQNNDGNTPLISAIKAGRTKIAVVLARKMSKDQINHQNKKGETALYCCVIKENTTVMESLIKHGANVNIATQTGTTPLMLSLYKNFPDIIKILLNENADTTLVDSNGQNCLHYYARTENYQPQTINYIRVISKNKTLFNSLDKSGHKPIHYAIEVGIADIINHFLSMSSLKDVGIVYTEVETVCKSTQRKRALTGRDRVSVLIKTDSLGYEINATNKPKEMDDYINNEERQQKWDEMIKFYQNKHKFHPKLIFRLYKGVPCNKRQDLWKVMLGIDEIIKENEGEFSKLALLERGVEEDDQIHKDVIRAHQNNVKFMCKFSDGQKKLFLALRAYANKDTEVGYVQGLADLFGFYVLVFNTEEEAFWGMYQTMNLPKYQLRCCFLRGFPGVQKFKTLETLMLKKYHPEIYTKVMKLGGYDSLYPHLLEYYALWFSRLFTGDLGIWILDIIIVEGWQITLSIASTIFFLLKDKILDEEDDLMSIDILLKKPQQLVTGFDKFLFIKYVKKNRIPPSQVDKWASQCIESN